MFLNPNTVMNPPRDSAGISTDNNQYFVGVAGLENNLGPAIPWSYRVVLLSLTNDVWQSKDHLAENMLNKQ